MGREERIHREAVELWCELYGEQPPPQAYGTELLRLITRRMPLTGYNRLASPFLRPANIAMPKRAGCN